MHPPPETRPRHRRYSVRRQARLDAETHAKLEELAHTFHRKRAQILRYVMQWALAHTQGWTVDPSIPDRPHLVHMLVDPELLQQVQAAAAAHGAGVAAWLRQAIRQVVLEDFPPSWRAEETAVRSHDSGYYARRFQLRLDLDSHMKLETLMQTFHRSAAEVVRLLIMQATPEDFPQRWHLAVQERRSETSRGEREGSPQRVPREDQP
jgi:hypothetical protein